MAIINITDKFSADKSSIQLGEKVYEVNNSMETVMKFEELAGNGSMESLVSAMEYAIGKAAVKELNIKKLSVSNFKLLITAIMASMQGVTLEEAGARFQRI
ncbi:hypothetical protein J2T13_004954 [Paenibacillus sp. DS2015]|uniref:hypothetical protein n=1 Tax=Paenibacillus sp. DS2015 TaxID=3373917 RepID=UPI003D21F73E